MTYPKGRIERRFIESKFLQNNLLGDPFTREIALYLPANYRESQHIPLFMAFSPYNSSGLAYIDWKPFDGSLIARLDRLISSGVMPPTAVIFPDCFTRLGGNQYINSSVIGLYEDFLIHEVLTTVEQNFNVGGPGHRACFGKSSGGFGAIMHGMRHPEVWSAIACHSGGMGFEWLFLCYVPEILYELEKHGRSIEKIFHHLEQKTKLTPNEFTCLMNLSFAAAYDPDPSQFLGLRLPVDLYTGELIPDRWKNWQQCDPSLIAQNFIGNLKKLEGIYIDCGDHDHYHLHFGARRLHKVLNEHNITHIYEEFPDNHTNLDYRFDISLPFLSRALASSNVD
ncbi:MAG: alpha/beta hydrolase [Janthinobacterium lividum]